MYRICVRGGARVFDYACISGNTWVSDNACVSGYAWVCDNASVNGNTEVSDSVRVNGNACVGGDACVSGNAWVSGNACVGGNAWICGNADYCCFQYFGSANRTTTAFKQKDGSVAIKCGCFFGSLYDFAKQVEKTHGDNKYGKQYKAIIEVIKAKFEL